MSGYARGAKPDVALGFAPDALPRAVAIEVATLAQLQAIAKAHDEALQALAAAQAATLHSEHERITLDAEVKRLQAEIAAIKAANLAAPDGHDYNEAQMRHFLKAHEDHITIQKLRRNEQLTPQDLSELERIMVAESVATDSELTTIHSDGGLGLFIRSLVGLEQDAAKAAFAEFIAGRALTRIIHRGSKSGLTNVA